MRMRVLSIKYRWHWKFWKPKRVIGGLVYFGLWVRTVIQDEDGNIVKRRQSWEQFKIKADMGLYR